MKRTWKRISSMFLSVCIILVMLPAAAYAEAAAADSGMPTESIGETAGAAEADAEVHEQAADTETKESDGNPPDAPPAASDNDPAIAAPVSGDEAETDSDAQEPEAQDEETENEIENTVTMESPASMLGSLAAPMSFESGTIVISQQPTPALSAPFDESPGTISVTAAATNGAPITYQWYIKYLSTGTSTSFLGEENTCTIPSGYTPDGYEFYCELTAEGCPTVESERTTVTVTKMAYTGAQSAAVYVNPNEETSDYIYTLPQLPASDMTYTLQSSGSALISGSPFLYQEAYNIWKLRFSTSSKPEGTQENILFTINGGILYENSSFALTVSTNKQPVSIIGITGTDNAYSGTPQTGYTGTPNTGVYTGSLEALYNGRNGTSYDSTIPPTDAGEYTVTLSIPSEANYTGSLAINFSIRKKEITVNPPNQIIMQGDELPDPNLIINYLGFNLAQGHNSNNSISRQAVAKLNVTDSNTPGVSDITFETYAELTTEKAKNYTLKHENGTLTILAASPPAAATGTMTVGGQTNVRLDNGAKSGTGWAWDASTATLTLDSGYPSTEEIDIQCGSSDQIKLVLAGDVTMNVTNWWGIDVSGKLTIQAGSHTLEVSSSWDAIQAPGGITIESGTVIAIGGGGNGLTTRSGSGDIIITGNANVTATGFSDPDPILSSNGIQSMYGNVIISTSGVVNAAGGKGGIYAGYTMMIERGTVNINGVSFALWVNDGITVNGGTVTTNGDVYGDLTVSGVSANVTVNGNITNPGNLTVSAGTVTVTGTVSGTTNHTGGTLNGDTPGSTVYTVTFHLNGGTRTDGGELTQSVPSGGSAAAPTVSRSGYTFTGWDKEFTNVTSNLTVTANWRYNSSHDSGSGSSSSGSSSSSGGSSSGASTTASAAAASDRKTNLPVTAAAPVTATAGANGTASADISDKAITDAIAKAQADAKAQGKIANGISVGLNVTMPKNTASLAATLTRSSLNSLMSAGVTSLVINGSPVTISFDQKALAEIQKQTTGNISITMAPNTSLSASAKAMIGSRPVYDLTISGGGKTVSGFGGGTATIAVPYTPGKNEASGGLYAVYVDANGNASRIAGSAYDANSGCVIFTTTHFSLYGIGYTVPSAKFTDITKHWAKESIDYVTGRALLSGTTATTFAPDTAITREMLVTALGRLTNVDTKAYTAGSFTDVKANSDSSPYIEWAYKKGILQGTGNSRFEPDKAITREEIAAVFANYAKATGYTLPVTRNATAYADASGIGSAYKTAVTAMQQAGVMMGSANNLFNPKSSVTRGEVSAMLHRYIKLTIDPATAYGWVKDDGGSNWYYFNADGTMAVSTKIGKYKVDGNGVRKEK